MMGFTHHFGTSYSSEHRHQFFLIHINVDDGPMKQPNSCCNNDFRSRTLVLRMFEFLTAVVVFFGDIGMNVPRIRVGIKTGVASALIARKTDKVRDTE